MVSLPTMSSFPKLPTQAGCPARTFSGHGREHGARRLHLCAARISRFAAARSTAAHYRLPLSEGVIDRSYAMLGLRLVRDALAREPRLYAMGMGGWDKPLPQMLKRLNWGMCAVPFYFKVVHPARFLRHIRALRTSPVRRAALDAAAFTGAGWLGMKALGLTRRTAVRTRHSRACLRPVGRQNLGALAPRLRPARPARRRHAGPTLSAVRPALPPRARGRRMGRRCWTRRCKTTSSSAICASARSWIAWPRRNPPPSVIRAAAGLLEQRGVDLIVSNQLHAAWSRALLESGFREGPSNFLLAISPAFVEASGGANHDQFHINRGDGDGPIHL